MERSYNAEVLVIGGGAAGTLAAISAARQNKDVLLLEAKGALGGSRTLMGVDTFNGFFSPGEKTYQLVDGICFEVVKRLQRRNAILIRQNTFGCGPVVTYDMEQLKIVYEEMVLEAGGRIMYDSFVPQLKVEDHVIKEVIVCNKAGLNPAKADVFVDATGDLDIGFLAGEDFELAGTEGKPVQSLTLVFYMADVDTKKAFAISQAERTQIMKDAAKSGKYHLTRIGGSIHPTPKPGYIHANLTRIPNVDATDPKALTEAKITARRQVQEYARFLVNEYPGFEKAYLASTACTIGIRETRRLKGQYILTGEDVRDGAKFEDAITCCAAPIEDHHAGKDVEWGFLEDGDFYQIPYRSLLPRYTKNLLVAGRCLSATHAGQASARNSAQCMAMGEAAGLAAALSLNEKMNPSDLDTMKLKESLDAQAALVEPKDVDMERLWK